MMQHRTGFSLIEALAAVAVIAIVLVPLYAMQGTLADAAFRIDRAADALEAEQSALDYLQTVNPMQQPEGAMDLGDWRLEWTADIVPGSGNPDSAVTGSRYAIALYDVEARLIRGDIERPITVRLIGYRLVAGNVGGLF